MDKYKFTASVNLFLIKDEKILLTLRKNTKYFPDCYEGPAGGMDGNETVRQAMVRETFEEIGIKLKVDDLSLVHVIHRKNRTDETNEYFEFYLTAKNWEGEPEIKEPNLCGDIAWFPINHLPNNMVPKTKQAIEQYLVGNFYSERDW